MFYFPKPICDALSVAQRAALGAPAGRNAAFLAAGGHIAISGAANAETRTIGGINQRSKNAQLDLKANDENHE